MRPEIKITDQNRDRIYRGQLCPYCGAKTNYIDSERIYGVSYGMAYICWPCKAYVGVHPGRPKKALGRLADSELRKWKKEAHRYFDQLWKKKIKQGHSKHISRTGAYKWLSEQLGIDLKYTHIGMFDIHQCKRTVELCKSLYKKVAA